MFNGRGSFLLIIINVLIDFTNKWLFSNLTSRSSMISQFSNSVLVIKLWMKTVHFWVKSLMERFGWKIWVEFYTIILNLLEVYVPGYVLDKAAWETEASAYDFVLGFRKFYSSKNRLLSLVIQFLSHKYSR